MRVDEQRAGAAPGAAVGRGRADDPAADDDQIEHGAHSSRSPACGSNLGAPLGLRPMQVHRSDDADSEQVSDALIDGDVVLVTGTARAALRHRDFRIYWSGVFASNIGTWMQNVLLGAYGFVLTHSAGYVGLLAFAQLGPLLFLSTVSGVLADTLDRRRLLVSAQLVQLALALVLAGLALRHHPSPVAIFFCVLAI